jgi:hypothetical protein
MIARLEADLEARSAALEASVAAAAGVPAQQRQSGTGAPGQANTPLDLAALLGVQETQGPEKGGKGGSAPTGAATSSHNQINMQMINILQSQRDQYKEKLTKASTRWFAVSSWCVE